MDKVRIIFILPSGCADESQASNIMIQAYESCKQLVANVSWVREDDYERIDLNKTDFLIFQDFKGKNFEHLKASKCARILGPWCVSICLMEGRPIPNFPWPIYNVAMDGCTISCSHLPKKVKLDMKENILLMGGCYTETLMSSNTHLITDSVGTEKYALAAEKGLKLMTSDWVDAVWNASQEANVRANDEQFNQYQCKPFHKLVICITGFLYKDRQVLSKHIAENGGTFTPKLNLLTTDILVCEGTAGSTSDKYKAARNTPSIQCVSAQWVYDSIEKGYALPCNLYPVKKSTSTPTKDDTLNPDFSMMSAIACSSRNENRTTLEETNLSTVSNLVCTPTKPTAKRKAHFEDEHITALEMLDIKKAKMAGQYLDGCSIYIAGFNFEQREKLSKVLNLSGATRYDDISDRITHVIIGDPSCHDLRMIKARGYTCSLVSVGWLLESMELQQPANEQKFLVNPDLDRSEIGSPLSKKGLSLLRTSRMVREMDIDTTSQAEKEPEEVDDVGNEILDLYLNPNQGTEQDTLAQLLKNADTNLDSRKEDPKETLRPPNETTSQPTATCTADYEDESQPLDIFNGFSFAIVGFDEEHAVSLTEMIECSGGTVVSPSSKSAPTYGVVPVFNTAEVKTKATEVVNNLYITECLQEGERQEIAYYHRPYVLKDTSPLEGCVITISGYSSFERSFLNNLIRELGGDAQDQFARKTATQKNIKACTHLVSLEANGKKYTAALKWGLPVVDKNWLLECANTGRMVPEQGYLVGDSKAPEVNENLPPNSLSKVHASVSGIINENTTLDQQPSTSKGPAPPAAHIDLTRENSTPDRTLRAHTSTSLEANENLISDPHHSSSRSIVQVSDKSDENSKPSSSTGISKVPTFVQPKAAFHTPPQQTATGRAQNGERPGSPDPCSQVTPVNKIMEEVRMSSLLGTPQTPPMPRAWGDFDTPETPLGAFIRPNPSPRLRKEMLRYLNQFPDFEPPRQRRQSTPMSELKRRLWDKVLKGLCGDSFTVDDETRQEAESLVTNRSVSEANENDENIHTTPPPNFDSVFNDSFGLKPLPPSNKETPENKLVQSKIMQLENLLTASTEKKRCSRNFQTSVPAQVVNPEMKDSQAFTVGWDYMPDTVENSPTRIFMISGVDSDTRQLLVPQIEQLGGIVSDLPNYDPSCTHLICPKPARNEKTLACMAAGKWILHISYIEKSVKAGKFLSEEEFEFGNEKSVQNISLTCDRDTEIRISASYWWRKEISRRGYGAFNDMRAIVVANKREPIIRVIEAGGGSVVNIEPPFDGSVHATHCLLEARSVPDYSVYFPLAEQGVYCVNTLYISEFLHRTSKDIRDCVLPYFVRYYK